MLQKEAISPGVLELLKSLQADPVLDLFHLAGGTGLALHLGHRISFDLDMFSEAGFDTNFFREYLIDRHHFNVDFSAYNTLKGSIGNIKVDFIAHPYKRVSPLIEEEKLRIYSVPDIAAMKLNAIAGSGTRSKDFVDLYFLLETFSIEQLLKFYETKYTGSNILHVVKSLNYFDDVDLSDWPVIIKERDLTWEKVKTEIDIKVKDFIKTL